MLGKTVFGRAIFTPPFKANATLSDEARFVYVVNGNSKLHSPTDAIELTTGDSMMMKCDQFVNHWKENNDGSATEIIIFQFFPEVLNAIYDGNLPEALKDLGTASVTPLINIGPNEFLSGFVQDMRRYFEQPKFLTEELIKLKIRELIHLLVSLNDPKVNAILRQLFQTPNYKFQEVIHSNLYANLKLEELAFLCGLSVSSFQRKFKLTFNTSPKQYMLTKRLEKSKSLLEKTDLSIAEIAYSCGFEDASHFSKSFSSTFHKSPKAFRASV